MQANSSKVVVNGRQRKQQLASKFLKHGDEEELTFTFNNYYQYSHVKTFAHNRRLVEAKRIEAIVDYQLQYSFTFHEVLADCQWQLPDLSLAQSKRRSAMMKQNLTRRMMDGVIAELKLLNGEDNQTAAVEPPIEFGTDCCRKDQPIGVPHYSPVSSPAQPDFDQQAQDVYYQDWLMFKELAFGNKDLLCREQLDSASPPATQLTTVPSTQQARRRLFANSEDDDVEPVEPPVPITASTPTDWNAVGEVEGMTTDEVDSDCQLIEQFDSPAPAQASVEQSTLLSTAGGAADDDDNLLDNLHNSYDAARQKYLRACGCWGEARRKVSNLKWAINKQSIKHTPLSTKERMCDRLFRYKLILKQRKRDYKTASAEWEAMKFTYNALGYTDEDTAARIAFEDAAAGSSSTLLGL